MSSYEKYTVLELKQLCRDRGCKGYSRMRKAEIIDLLKGTCGKKPGGKSKPSGPKVSSKKPTPKTSSRKTPVTTQPTPSPTSTTVEITAKEVYDIVLDEIPNNGILSAKIGSIEFNPDTVDIVGGVIEVWIGKLIRSLGYYIRHQKKSQEFPDYYLQKGEYKDGLLEIKAFNMYKGLTNAGHKKRNAPAFDLANFYSYVDTLTTDAYKLNAHYLVFGYEWIGRGKFVIRQAWLFQIADLVGVDQTDAAEANLLGIQKKRGDFYNIRPLNFNSVGGKGLDKAAGSKIELIKAIYRTLMKGKKKNLYKDWPYKVRDNYYKHTGNYLFKEKVIDGWVKKYS